jgi:hypothetical protein
MTNSFTLMQERQKAELARVAALTDTEKRINAASHHIGIVDDCRRCVDCEIGSWNAWKAKCI